MRSATNKTCIKHTTWSQTPAAVILMNNLETNYPFANESNKARLIAALLQSPFPALQPTDAVIKVQSQLRKNPLMGGA